MTRLVSILIIILIWGTVWAQTDVHLGITTEGYTRIRIALAEPPHGLPPDLSAYYQDFTGTLHSDLELSGYFEIVEDLKADAPHTIVDTQLEEEDQELGFTIHVTDRVSGQTIFKRRYGSSAGQITRVAHIVADDIVYALTGRRGIANTRIAFVAGEKGDSHLYSVHIDGTELTRLTEAGTIVMSPSWSPDGARIAYVWYEGSHSSVYVVTGMSNPKRTKFTSFEGLNASPAWSPDGTRLAVTLSKDGNPEIYILALDGSSQKRITYYSGIDCSPTWAPNGLELAFTSDRTGTPHIFVTDIEGLNVRKVTFDGNYNTSPAWSPEGDRIAFVSRVNGGHQICTVDPFGVTTHILTERGNNEDPEWSPAGVHIVFSSTVGGNSGIYIMNRDGSQKRKIFDGMKKPRNPTWSPPLGYRMDSQVEG